MMKDCKITMEWCEGEDLKKRAVSLNLPNEEKEIVLIHLRAGFKAIYRSFLQHLGYSSEEIVGMMSTQMCDKPRKIQKEAVIFAKKLFKNVRI